MNARGQLAIALSLAWIGITGCGGGGGPQPIPVKGVVTIDGKPEAGISVNFVVADNPGKTPASGVTDAEGKFSLMTFNMNDGAIPGTYKVTVARTVAPSGQAPVAPAGAVMTEAERDAAAKIMKEMEEKGAASATTLAPIPEKYRLPATTPLGGTVGSSPPGRTEFTFDVSTK